jgi:hypothetical protein
MSGMNLKEE